MSSPITACSVDAAALADELATLRLIDPLQLNKLLAAFPGGGPVALAELLVTRGVLTHFQAERALAGEAHLLVLGPYRLTESAGPGVFGPEYLASCADHPGRFRLGVFPRRSVWRARRAKQLARKLREAVLPAVVPLVDAGTANGFHYLAWPHVTGQSLADRVAAAGPLPVAVAAGLLAQLAEALDACHRQHVLHGTITPQAVVFDADGSARLLELGAGVVLAENLTDDESLLDSLSTANGAARVMEYAAPEFVADPTALTPTADQYALAAVGYFALAGQPPFPRASLPDQLAARQAGPPRPLREVNPGVPPELAAIIERMLRPNPADRFAGLDEVRHRLAALATEGGSPPAVRQRPESGAVESLPRTELLPEPVCLGPFGTGAAAAQFPNRVHHDGAVTFELPAPQGHDGPIRSPPPPIAAGSPASPAARTSPAQPEDLHMAKLVHADPFAVRTGTTPLPDALAKVAAPVRYHTEPDPADGPLAAEIEPDDPPAAESALWKKLKRNLLFWQAARDVVQVSVFGPPAVAPGQSAKLSVYLHTPDATDSVHTLSRAFHHDAVLIGTGCAACEVARQSKLAVHLAVANAGVSKSLLTFVWRGQPHRLVFDLHVPWESPAGPAPGLVSLGRDDVRIGKIEFRLTLLPRK